MSIKEAYLLELVRLYSDLHSDDLGEDDLPVGFLEPHIFTHEGKAAHLTWFKESESNTDGRQWFITYYYKSQLDVPFNRCFEALSLEELDYVVDIENLIEELESKLKKLLREANQRASLIREVLYESS